MLSYSPGQRQSLFVRIQCKNGKVLQNQQQLDILFPVGPYLGYSNTANNFYSNTTPVHGYGEARCQKPQEAQLHSSHWRGLCAEHTGCTHILKLLDHGSPQLLGSGLPGHRINLDFIFFFLTDNDMDNFSSFPWLISFVFFLQKCNLEKIVKTVIHSQGK